MPVEDIPTLPAFPDGFVPPDPFERRPGDTARQSWVRVWPPPPPFLPSVNGSQRLLPSQPPHDPGHEDFSIPRTHPPGFPTHFPSNGPPSSTPPSTGFPPLPPGIPLPPSPSGLRVAFVGTVAANNILIGAIGLKVAHALCRPPPQHDHKNVTRSSSATAKVTVTLLVAAFMVIVSLVLESIVIPIVGFGSPISQGFIRLLQQWILLFAVILMCGIAYRRAMAIQSVWPQIKAVAQVSTGAFLFLAISTRGMATVYEIQAVTLQVSPFQTMWIRQVMRSVLNASAAVYMLFMEGVVTAVIFWYRDGYALNALRNDPPLGGRRFQAPRSSAPTGQPCGGSQVKADSSTLHKWYLCTPSARLRIMFSALISLIFVAQAALQVLNIWGITIFAPFWSVGWSLFLIRLFEFRVELGSGRRPSPNGNASGDDEAHPSHGRQVAHHDSHIFLHLQRQHTHISRQPDSARSGTTRPPVGGAGTGVAQGLCLASLKQQPAACAVVPLPDVVASDISEEIVIICESPVGSGSLPWSPSPPPTTTSHVPTRDQSPKATAAWELLSDVANQRWDGSLELGAHVRVERNQRHG